MPLSVLNKLTRSQRPEIADLQGPGPFQLPHLTAVEGTVQAPEGHVGIGLETGSAQAARIVLTDEAAAKLHDLLGAYFAIQMQNAPDRKN